MAIIDDITNSRDKLGPIRRLHALSKANPTVDVTEYLQKVSNVFRKFVLDTLKKLDSDSASSDSAAALPVAISRGIDENGSRMNGAPSVTSTTYSKPPALSVSVSTPGKYLSVGSMSGDEEGVEAMRILDGLKANRSMQESSPRYNEL